MEAFQEAAVDCNLCNLGFLGAMVYLVRGTSKATCA